VKFLQRRVDLFTPSYCRADFLFCCLARQMDDSESKDTMLRIAEDYARLASRADDRALGRLPKWTKH
jgi:hypothetical protein